MCFHEFFLFEKMNFFYICVYVQFCNNLIFFNELDVSGTLRQCAGMSGDAANCFLSSDDREFALGPNRVGMVQVETKVL